MNVFLLQKNMPALLDTTSALQANVFHRDGGVITSLTVPTNQMSLTATTLNVLALRMNSVATTVSAFQWRIDVISLMMSALDVLISRI